MALDIFISIHAPARGATIIAKEQNLGSGISIHAPARGATIAWMPLQEPYKDFNPRAREGRDYKIFDSESEVYISIHAPARGATEKSGVSSQAIIISIHAPARGATSRYSL